MPITMSTFAGTPNVSGHDSTHMGTPASIGIDNDGIVYFADIPPSGTKMIRKANPDGSIEDLIDYSTTLPYASVGSIAVNRANSNVYFLADDASANPHKLYVNGVFLAGSNADFAITPGTLTGAHLGYGIGDCMAVNPATDDVYFQSWKNADSAQGVQILKVAGATMSVFAGTNGTGNTDGTGTSASFNPSTAGATFDDSGNLYIVNRESSSGSYNIRKITASGVTSHLCVFTTSAVYGSGTDTFVAADITYAPDANLYVVGNQANASYGSLGDILVLKVTPGGTISTVYTITSGGLPSGIAADFDGNLYIGMNGGSKSYSIQKLAGVYDPVLTLPKTSTLKDGFGSLDTAKWTVTDPADIVSGRLELGGGPTAPGTQGAIVSAAEYNFDSVFVEVPHAGYGMWLLIQSQDTSDFVRIIIDPEGALSEPGPNANTWTVRADWQFDGVPGHGGGTYLGLGAYYDPDVHKWLKVERIGDTIDFATSADGLIWETLYTYAGPVSSYRLSDVHVVIVGHLWTAVDNVNLAPSDTDPGSDVDILVPPPIDDPTADYPIPSVQLPDANAPAETSPGSATVLDLIRQFSGETRSIVRLTSATSIEIVDPNHPLPTGWSQADAAGLFWMTHRSAQAGIRRLSLEDRGDLALGADANIGTDDVRLIVSDWQLPNQLPVYGLRPAPVLSWSWQFTPEDHTCSVRYWFPVPLAVVVRSTS